MANSEKLHLQLPTIKTLIKEPVSHCSWYEISTNLIITWCFSRDVRDLKSTTYTAKVLTISLTKKDLTSFKLLNSEHTNSVGYLAKRTELFLGSKRVRIWPPVTVSLNIKLDEWPLRRSRTFQRGVMPLKCVYLSRWGLYWQVSTVGIIHYSMVCGALPLLVLCKFHNGVQLSHPHGFVTGWQ